MGAGFNCKLNLFVISLVIKKKFFLDTDGNKFKLIMPTASSISGEKELKTVIIFIASAMVVCLIVIMSLVLPSQLYLQGYILALSKKQESSLLEDISHETELNKSTTGLIDALVEDDAVQSDILQTPTSLPEPPTVPAFPLLITSVPKPTLPILSAFPPLPRQISPALLEISTGEKKSPLIATSETLRIQEMFSPVLLKEISVSSSFPAQSHRLLTQQRQNSPSLPIITPTLPLPISLKSSSQHIPLEKSQSEKDSEYLKKSPPLASLLKKKSSHGRMLILGPYSVGKKRKVMFEFRLKKNNQAFFYKRKMKVVPEIPEQTPFQSKHVLSVVDVQETGFPITESAALLEDAHADAEEAEPVIPEAVNEQKTQKRNPFKRKVHRRMLTQNNSTPRSTVVKGEQSPPMEKKSSQQSISHSKLEYLEDYAAEQDETVGAIYEVGIEKGRKDNGREIKR